ncbi:MAG: PIN domain-containing protein, partial [Thermodesulfobacteriota bacterium]|nr:PIN domain-containing protein [Thermodesulfobacteriota bacterium]
MIVVDTHVIIWDALKPKLLSKKAKNAINEANERDGIIFCEISLWEIAMLIKKARISIDTSYQDFIKIVFLS